MKRIEITDPLDWGIPYSEADASAYGDAVVEAVHKHYPDATVTWKQGNVSVTKVNADGYSWEEFDQIVEDVIEAHRDIWERGEFWSNEE